MSTQVDATFWAAVVPSFSKVWRGGQYVDGVSSVSVKKIWQKQPDRAQVTAGTVVVKLTIRFNEEAFMPLQPAAVIQIPDSVVLAGQVLEVEADEEDPERAAQVAEYLAERARRGE